jgi:hypothetical protein
MNVRPSITAALVLSALAGITLAGQQLEVTSHAGETVDPEALG